MRLSERRTAVLYTFTPSDARSRRPSLICVPLDPAMPHPYLTRRAEIIGFIAVVLVIAAGCAFYFRLPVVGVAALLAAAVAFGLAVYSQIQFGPRISEVRRTAPWPPNSVLGWFGVFMFVLAIIGIGFVVFWHVLHAHKI